MNCVTIIPHYIQVQQADVDAAGVGNFVLAEATSPVGNVASNATVWNALERVSMIAIGEMVSRYTYKPQHFTVVSTHRPWASV